MALFTVFGIIRFIKLKSRGERSKDIWLVIQGGEIVFELICEIHKKYKGKRKPRSGCEKCWDIYLTKIRSIRADCPLYTSGSMTCLAGGFCKPSSMCHKILDKKI